MNVSVYVFVCVFDVEYGHGITSRDLRKPKGCFFLVRKTETVKLEKEKENFWRFGHRGEIDSVDRP